MGKTFKTISLGKLPNVLDAKLVGKLLYLALPSGFAIFDCETDKILNYEQIDLKTRDFVTSIAVTSNKVFLGSSMGIKVFSLDGKLQEVLTKKNGFVSSEVQDLIVNKENLYVATRDGVAVSKDGGKTFHNYSKKDGMWYSSINVLNVTPSGKVYAGSVRGLFVADGL